MPGCNISSIESNVNIGFVEAETAINSLSIIWKFYLSHKIKREFSQAEAVSILLSAPLLF